MELEHKVYIIEIKLGGKVEEAIQQIEKRGYAERYMKKGKELPY